MSLITLHRKCSIAYENRLCSFAAFITLCVLLMAVISPFVWIYKSNSDKFSRNNDFIIFSQPVIKFKYKFILLAENSMDNEEKVIMCSSFDLLNNEHQGENCAKLKVVEKDENYDGVPDEIQLSVELHTTHKYGIKMLSLVAFFDGFVYDQCLFNIPTAIVVIQKPFVNLYNRKILISGSFQPYQNQALQCPFLLRRVRSHFFYERINENQTNLDEFHFENIKENLERNPIFFYFQESSTELQEIEEDKTIVRIKINIPEIPIRYRKTFWQLVNDLWINYIAIFLITLTVYKFILNYLFENRYLRALKRNHLLKKEY
ncbi:CLUMA_CG008195, isoform A [Clunio marinus]|uniref:Transmembrane protein 231 n=1 Tax=Clunio marinus TaxID=568069 RepID=A0A1J1I2X0_9DIPT|nr:CLUMA_CG008195, isoform A [Clunio marinus]